jgi:tetratricopeptide (TPR) repeat protein
MYCNRNYLLVGRDLRKKRLRGTGVSRLNQFTAYLVLLMIKFIRLAALFLAIALSFPAAAQEQDALDAYIGRLRQDHAGDRKETGFLSAGSDILYGQDYFEARNYAAAVNYFKDALKKEPENAFASYQVAMSLIRQNDKYKTQQAQTYLQQAFRINPALQERYKKENPSEAAKPASTAGSNNVPAGAAPAATGIDAYIEGLKHARSVGGPETAMNTPGRDALYGIGYYEKNEYVGAETEFRSALAREPNNPYVNYMLAVSLTALGKKTEATSFLQKAFAGAPSLKNRYPADAANAVKKWNQVKNERDVTTTAAPRPATGGPLVYGKYTCTQTVYNGAGASPAFSYPYKGYFELKSDGTYRWLDNGGTGRYQYDAATGTITWLSGYFKNVSIQSTRYQVNKSTVQMTVNFTGSYRWECGCNKK